VVDLKSRTMRPDLERLGVWRPERSRERVEAAFAPGRTLIVEVDGERVGCVSVRDTDDAHWLELFYLEPDRQGSGLGTAVLREVLARYDDSPLPVRLDVLHGSRARALYERHGFVHESEDDVDVFMVRRNDGGRRASRP
jgi:GNAT superfamily N-acetyltransferase